ncbi:unnamed protein product, partial [Effrenium voratum]
RLKTSSAIWAPSLAGQPFGVLGFLCESAPGLSFQSPRHLDKQVPVKLQVPGKPQVALQSRCHDRGLNWAGPGLAAEHGGGGTGARGGAPEGRLSVRGPPAPRAGPLQGGRKPGGSQAGGGEGCLCEGHCRGAVPGGRPGSGEAAVGQDLRSARWGCRPGLGPGAGRAAGLPAPRVPRRGGSVQPASGRGARHAAGEGPGVAVLSGGPDHVPRDGRRQ